MAMSKKKKRNGVIIILVSIILIAVFGFNLFAIIGEGYLEISPQAYNTPPPEVEDFNWGTYQGTATSVFFGQLKSGESALNQGSASLCGDNNGEVTINNDYSVSGEQLELHSITGGTPCGVNYLYSNITLPPGTLTAKCVLSVSPALTFSGGTSLCRIDGIISETVSVMGWQIEQGTPSFRERIVEFVINETTEINIKLETRTDGGIGSASSSLTLSFEEPEPEQPILYYRNNGTDCSAIPLIQADITENDYTTYYECVYNIPEPTPEPEPTPPPTPITIYIIIGIVVVGGLAIMLRKK